MKSYLICVDSDGCAMDTMTVKHVKCFGPYMVEEWNLQKWAEPILNRWNEMNLYSMTRGINRFKGLAAALTEIDRQYTSIAGVNELAKWVSESDLLSEAALQKVVEEYPEQIIWKKALRWSKKGQCRHFGINGGRKNRLCRCTGSIAEGEADSGYCHCFQRQSGSHAGGMGSLRLDGICGLSNGTGCWNKNCLPAKNAGKGISARTCANDWRRPWRSNIGTGGGRALLSHFGRA